MKKVMLFIAALMFSVAANAAPLDLVQGASGSALIDPSSGVRVAAAESNSTATAVTPDEFILTVASAGTLTFDGDLFPAGATSYFEVLDGAATLISLVGGAATDSFMVALFVDAGTYVVNVFSESGRYHFNIETPIPAALFLFAPALLGFMGLRRKSTLAA